VFWWPLNLLIGRACISTTFIWHWKSAIHGRSNKLH
jgi:hypothetical protein